MNGERGDRPDQLAEQARAANQLARGEATKVYPKKWPTEMRGRRCLSGFSTKRLSRRDGSALLDAPCRSR